jgi:hypothetical protein
VSLDKSVDYEDLVVGKLYRFTANSHTFTTNGRGERSGGPYKSIQFFLLSPELQYEFDGSSLGLTIKVLVGEDVHYLFVSTSWAVNGKPIMGGTFSEVEDD